MYSFLGQLGENKACEFLIRNGFSILDRNFRTRYGEIDIICKEGVQYVFVEVKTRSSILSGYPYEAVTLTKQAKIIKCGLFYLKSHQLPIENIRVDVISIVVDGNLSNKYSLDHYKNVLAVNY